MTLIEEFITDLKDMLRVFDGGEFEDDYDPLHLKYIIDKWEKKINIEEIKKAYKKARESTGLTEEQFKDQNVINIFEKCNSQDH